MTLEQLLEDRAERGLPRGAEAVYEAALLNETPIAEPGRSASLGRSVLWAAAAAIVLIAGVAVWPDGSGDATDLTLVQNDPASPSVPTPTSGPTSTAAPTPTAPPTAPSEAAPGVPPSASPSTDLPAPDAPPTPAIPAPPTEDSSDCPVHAGAIAGQPGDVNCRTLSQAPDTAVASANRWLDDFDHDASFADFTGTSYRVTEVGMGEWWNGSVFEAQPWRHANHWMVDVQTGGQGHAGGVFVRPNQSFTFEDGTLVVETDAVAGHPDYLPGAWPELIITTADDVTGARRDALYGYDRFPGHYTLGCRLQADSNTICSLFDQSDGTQQGQGRLWEMSWFQEIGRENFGGNNFVDQAEYYRQCDAGDPDTECRDRFRLKLTEDSVTIYVNGLLYFQQTGVPALPPELTEGDVYVYFASMVASQPEGTTRFHWDRVAVNPETGPSASPTWP